MRVFLVDDSLEVVERVKAMLAPLLGVEVTGSANDIPEALRSIRATRPDVVLLDLRLPSGSGVQVLDMIKDEKLGIIPIVLTNYAFAQYRKRCTEAGAYAFLDKSTDFVKVPQVLSALFDLHDQAQRLIPLPGAPSPSEPKVKVGSQ